MGKGGKGREGRKGEGREGRRERGEGREGGRLRHGFGGMDAPVWCCHLANTSALRGVKIESK